MTTIFVKEDKEFNTVRFYTDDDLLETCHPDDTFAVMSELSKEHPDSTFVVKEENTMNIYELMNIAQEELKRRLPENQETDDWQWSEAAYSFGFVINIGTTEDFEDFEVSEPYYFHYDANNARCGKTPEEQLMRWLNKYF